jgi:hypothetical protein
MSDQIIEKNDGLQDIIARQGVVAFHSGQTAERRKVLSLLIGVLEEISKDPIFTPQFIQGYETAIKVIEES